MTTFTPGNGLSFQPVDQAKFSYSLTVNVGYDDFDASTVVMLVDDTNLTRITSDYSDPYYDIEIHGDATGVALSALDATGTLNGSRLDRVSNGNCRVKANSFAKIAIADCDMTRINGNVYDEFISYEAGSLAQHLVASITALVGSKTSSAKPIYSTQNHAAATYVRNSACWAASINLTAFSPWNSREANYRAGVAITPRHTIQAAHYPLAVSDTIRFITTGNAVVTRTVSGINSISGSDIQIALLDSDLPASITPISFAPENLYDYLPSLQTFSVPMLATDYEEKAFIKENFPAYWSNASHFATFRNSPTDPFSRMTEAIISGDSGNPVCMVINGSPVIISHWLGIDYGPLYHTFLTEIAAALTSLGGGHSLSTVNLSSFTDYS